MKTMSHDGEPRRTTVVNEAGWGRSSRGDSTGQGGCRSSLLGHPARSFFRARDVKIGKPPVEAARAVDAKNAPTAPWKTAQNAVSHSSHRPLPVSLVTGKVLPMFPVNFVTYVPGCTPCRTPRVFRSRTTLGLFDTHRERPMVCANPNRPQTSYFLEMKGWMLRIPLK